MVMRRLGIILSLIACTPLAYGSNITLTSECSQVSVKNYLWDGQPADAAPKKIYKFVNLKNDMIAAVKDGDKTKAGCLGQIWEQGLKEQADYVGDRVKNLGCKFDADLNIAGGCDKNNPAVQEYADSNKFINHLSNDLNDGVHQARAAADEEVDQAEQEARVADRAANQRNCPQQPVAENRADAQDFVCCGAKGGSDGAGHAGGAIGDLHPDLSYNQCLAKTRPSPHSMLGYGALACVGNGILGWLSGFWNALSGPFKLVGALWGARAQIWGLMSSSAARSKFADDLGKKIAGLFQKLQDKGQSALCYNGYEREQALCHFVGAVLGTIAAPDAFGMLLGLVAKPLGKGVEILEGYLNKTPKGQKALEIAKTVKNTVRNVKNDIKGKIGEKTPPRLKDVYNNSIAKLKKLEEKRKKIAAAQYAIPKAIVSKTYRNELLARLKGSSGGAVIADASLESRAASAAAAQTQVDTFSHSASQALASGDARAAAKALGAGRLTVRKGSTIAKAADAQHLAVEHAEEAGTLTAQEAAAKHEEIAKTEALATGKPERSWTRSNQPTSVVSTQPAAGAPAPQVVSPQRIETAQRDVTNFTKKIKAERNDGEGNLDVAGAKASFRSKTNKGIRQEANALRMQTDQLVDAGKITAAEGDMTIREIGVAEAKARGLKKIPQYVRPADRLSADAARAAREANEPPVAPVDESVEPSQKIARGGDAGAPQGKLAKGTQADAGAAKPTIKRGSAVDAPVVAQPATLKGESIYQGFNEPAVMTARSKEAFDQVNGFLEESGNLNVEAGNAAEARKAFNVETKNPFGRTKKVNTDADLLHEDVDHLVADGHLTAEQAAAVHHDIEQTEMTATGAKKPRTWKKGEIPAAPVPVEPSGPAAPARGQPAAAPVKTEPVAPVAAAPASGKPLPDIGMPRPSVEAAQAHVDNFVKNLQSLPDKTDIVEARKTLFVQTDKVGVLREARELHAEVDQLQAAGKLTKSQAKQYQKAISDGEVRATGLRAQKWAPGKTKVWTNPQEPPVPSADLPPPAAVTARAQQEVSEFNSQASQALASGDARAAQKVFGVGRLTVRKAAAIEKAANVEHLNIERLQQTGTITAQDAAAKHEEIAKLEALASGKPERNWLRSNQPAGAVAGSAAAVDVARTQVNAFMHDYKQLSDGVTPAQARKLFQVDPKKGWNPLTRNKNQVAATLEESRALHDDINLLREKGTITDELAQQMHQTVAHAESLATNKPPMDWSSEVAAEPPTAPVDAQPAGALPSAVTTKKATSLKPLGYLALRHSKQQQQTNSDPNRDPQSFEEPTVDIDQLFAPATPEAPRTEIPDDAPVAP